MSPITILISVIATLGRGILGRGRLDGAPLAADGAAHGPSLASRIGRAHRLGGSGGGAPRCAAAGQRSAHSEPSGAAALRPRPWLQASLDSPPMREVEFNDAIFGHVVVSFDGRVLELFRPGLGSVHRMHAPHLARVEQSGPDRRGNYTADFCPTKRGGFQLTVPGDAWPQVTELINTISVPG
jgi:hypothetical protein